jgi:alkylhydroperoxidase family enzyme
MGMTGPTAPQRVVAAIPPIDFGDLPDPLPQLLAPRVERLGYLGGFFQHTAHQPRALAAFIEFTESLKDALPEGLTETVALAVAGRLGNRYELNQHEQLARRLGFSDVWIRAAADGSGFDEIATPGQRAVRSLVTAILRDAGRNCGAELDAAVEAVGVEPAVGVLLLAGRYVAHSVVANALELHPPVLSIFGVAR